MLRAETKGERSHGWGGDSFCAVWFMCSLCALRPCKFISIFPVWQSDSLVVSMPRHNNTVYRTWWLILIYNLSQRLHLWRLIKLWWTGKERATEERRREDGEGTRCFPIETSRFNKQPFFLQNGIKAVLEILISLIVLGPVSQKHLKAKMIVKSIFQTFLSLRGVSQKHRNWRHS